MVVGGHRGMGMNAVGAPPGARVAAVRERENTLLSFARAADHAAVAFVEFDVQVRYLAFLCCHLPSLVLH
jgi:glycerophosphodiester phosphodiesterase